MLLSSGRVVSNFIMQALHGNDITIYGDGSQTSSSCYVDDLIECLVRLMNHPSQIGPVNLGKLGKFTMIELAEMDLKGTGGSSNLTCHPGLGDDPKQRKPYITLAKCDLDWDIKVALEEGLDWTIAYFRR